MNLLDQIMNAIPTFSRRQPEKESIVLQAQYRQQLYLSRKDAEDLRQAINAADNENYPSRNLLMQIYKNIELDAQLSSLVHSRKIKTLGKEFSLIRKHGKEKAKVDEDMTALFHSDWFTKLLGHVWDAQMYGYSIIQLGDIENGGFNDMKLLPRTNIIPEKKILVDYTGSIEGVSYEDHDWVIAAYGNDRLGAYSFVALSVLYKKAALAAQAQMVELFGVPLRLGKTDMADKERAQSMFGMLRDMGSAGYGVVDKDDEVEFIETAKAGGGGAHKDFIAYLDEQISKAILGQTMLSDSGSSLSQSEVHERLANDYVTMDLRFVESVVNGEIIPKLLRLGFTQLKGCTFAFTEAENKDALFEQVVKLVGAGYKVSSKFIEETFGIPVEEPETKQEAEDEPTGLEQ